MKFTRRITAWTDYLQMTQPPDLRVSIRPVPLKSRTSQTGIVLSTKMIGEENSVHRIFQLFQCDSSLDILISQNHDEKLRWTSQNHRGYHPLSQNCPHVDHEIQRCAASSLIIVSVLPYERIDCMHTLVPTDPQTSQLCPVHGRLREPNRRFGAKTKQYIYIFLTYVHVLIAVACPSPHERCCHLTKIRS